jgi:hypothetical protein
MGKTEACVCSSEPGPDQATHFYAPVKPKAASCNPQSLEPIDPSLTLARMQYPATEGNTGNRNPVVYAGSATYCNPQQPLTAHS